jgi:hypothetical protein
MRWIWFGDDRHKSRSHISAPVSNYTMTLDESTARRRPMEILPVLVVTPAVAAVVDAVLHSGGMPSSGFLLFVAAVAGLIGLPAVVWALDTGRTSFGTFAILGTLAGVLVPLLMLLSGALGLWIQGNWDYAVWALGAGAPIPTRGLYRWPDFFRIALESMAVGTLSALVCRLFLRKKDTA